MKEGPDIALLGALIGDPARASMLTALLSGKALTAGELAREGGVTIQTASSHLAKLETAGLLLKQHQGRHRYFALADSDVAHILEAMMGLAAKRGHMRTRTGPRDPELRKARVCYNHLAGEMGVYLFENLLAQQKLRVHDDQAQLTARGESFLSQLGIDLSQLGKSRRPVCKPCLDWSSRRNHLAGSLGTALLEHVYQWGWATRVEGSRIVRFTPSGEKKFRATFGGPPLP